jgi:tetratricopeptide (TPR) repeat protein
VRDELFPKIDATYRTLPYRILVGHSIGGLIALHALLIAPEMFQGYIAIDPSLWWDNEVTVHRAEGELESDQERRSSVYISMANHPGRGDLDPKKMDEPIHKFARMLDATSCHSFRSMLQYYEAEDHGSVPLLSLYHGLLYLFEGYKPRPEEFFDQPSVLSHHFERVSERLGIDLLPPEKLVHLKGLSFLNQRNDVDGALEYMKLNVANYPGSYNAHDSLAAAFAVKGEKDLAIEHYGKSLALNPDNENAVEKLQELRGEKPQEGDPEDG